jgi:hypothetical protein
LFGRRGHKTLLNSNPARRARDVIPEMLRGRTANRHAPLSRAN